MLCEGVGRDPGESPLNTEAHALKIGLVREWLFFLVFVFVNVICMYSFYLFTNKV